MSEHSVGNLSATALSDYLDCSLRFKLARIDRVQPEFAPDAMLFGTAIHSVLAEFYRHLQSGRRLDLESFLEIFRSTWTNLAQGREDVRWSPGKDFEQSLVEGLSLLSVFHSQLPEEKGRILAIEEPFELEVPGLPPILGIIDLVLEDEGGTITVVDHKTSSRAYSDSEILKSVQLAIYQMAVKASGYGDREVLLRFDCLIKTRVPKFEQYFSTRDQFDEQKTIKKLRSVWNGINKGVFVPNEESWKCDGCQYKTACRKWFEEGAQS